jgi:dCTP diphosphatase
VAGAIEAKMAANAKKYPVERASGRAEKYTEL